MCSQINHDDDGGGGLLSGGLLSVPVSRIYSTPTTKPAVATSVSKHLRHQNVCKSNTSDSTTPSARAHKLKINKKCM